MIFKESEVRRIHDLLRRRGMSRNQPTTLREAIRFTLEHAEPLAVVRLPIDSEPGRAA